MTKRTEEFDARVVSYLPYLRKQAARMERDEQKREDLVSETVIKLLDTHHTFRPEGGFVNWMYWTMRGVATSNHRRVNKEVEDPDGKVAAAVAVPSTQEDQAYVSEVLSRIPAKHSEIVQRLVAGWTHEEIGAERGITRQAVASYISRARAAVRHAANDNRPLRRAA